MTLFIIFNSIFFSFCVHAALICAPRISQFEAVADIPEFISKTAIVGPPDRRNLKDFARESHRSEREISQKYAASGDIVCGGQFAQAQVVLKNDLILVSNHLLYENRDCEKARDVKQCKLYLTENGKRVIYDVAKEEAEGFACPDNKSMKSRNDWAILRLAKPVSASVKPYSIKSMPCVVDGSPEDTVFIGKSIDYRSNPTQRMLEAPKHYGRCAVQKGNCPNSTDRVLLSDCDQDGGSSGGGLFVGNDEPQLIGLMSSLRNTCPESASEKAGPYSEKCWSSVAVPISGELQERLEALARESVTQAL